MNAIVIARFSVMRKAAQAVDTLRKSCVSDDRVRAILLNPPAPHPERSARAKPQRTANVVPLAGRHAPAQAAMLESIGNADRRSPDRPAGVLVAVETPNHVARSLAVSVFSKHGARTVEADAGTSLEGNWPGAVQIPLDRLDKFGAEVIPALCRPKPHARQH